MCWGRGTALSVPLVLFWFWFCHCQGSCRSLACASPLVLLLLLQFPAGIFCSFFTPFLTSEVLGGHLLLQFILGSCSWIWELSDVSVLVACGFLSGFCVRTDTLLILGWNLRSQGFTVLLPPAAIAAFPALLVP